MTAAVVAIATALRIQAYRTLHFGAAKPRPPGTPPTVYEVAYLRAGERRVVETALVALHLAGRLSVVRSYRLTMTGEPPPEEEIQADIAARLATARDRDARELRDEAEEAPSVRRLAERLVQGGLTVRPAAHRAARSAAARQRYATLLPLAAGLMVVVLELARDRSALPPLVAFALLAVVAQLAAVCTPVPFHLPYTHAGLAMLDLVNGQRSSWVPALDPGLRCGEREAGVLARVARDGLRQAPAGSGLRKALDGPPVRPSTGSTSSSGRSSSGQDSSSRASDPPGLGSAGCASCGGCGGCGGGL
ncbi:TIGR04222 domain-containing membrane protein [Streptomyces sp. NPDC018031]|uniref:TIGR04222 domain-containing membrane protein n=1 Tax=Streptomyces sp. NPDC018031 TaxID=3365033 RepID=UPI0037999AFB